jgi:hypothetical protein
MGLLRLLARKFRSPWDWDPVYEWEDHRTLEELHQVRAVDPDCKHSHYIGKPARCGDCMAPEVVPDDRICVAEVGVYCGKPISCGIPFSTHGIYSHAFVDPGRLS